MKKFLSLLLIFTLLFSLSANSFADVQPPWTENVEARSTSSLHLQVHNAAAVASALSVKFGGPASNYLWIGISWLASTYTADHNNVYYKVRYYWRPSGDPQLPFYIKQNIYVYADSARTQFIGLQTNYYYSSITQ